MEAFGLDTLGSIKVAGVFSILADETADISCKEQFSLCVRYLETNTLKLREDFLKFVPVTSLTGESLAQTLLDNLINLGIDCSFMVGQGYDGAAAMSGRFNGVQALNLAISDACDLQSIRNCMGALSSVYNFFNTPKRQEVLLSKIASIETNTKTTRLKNVCPTRWIQRHESVLIFLELQNAVTISLETISSWQDKTTCSTALQLLSAIQDVEFQISLRTTAKIFGITSPLSRLLQTENLDLSTAMILATNIEEMLIKMRNDSEKEFNYIFNDVQKICSDRDVDVKIPRKVGRQVHCSNIETDSPEVYFRVSIFIPFLDFFITQIQRRLLDHKQILSSFHCLLPSKINNLEFKKQFETDIVHLVRRYEKIVKCSEQQSIGELRLWWNYVSQMNDNLKNAHSALLVCDEKIFPIIRKLLVILVTLPVTTATPERTENLSTKYNRRISLKWISNAKYSSGY
ncbi:52 kDa repressor of the inhibitor of the protein kinase-like [Acyrthosiphon pisum]|uniref:DUF4371 domain-containing protein n=1 Tax=Acyrthosiphon pisum TaxID=7029 RepID=A0A8R2B048_ACYPI|nr:52 kDa repressor of the inhibitor of the protein kinase-like [Acyrthosiphon pisum]|eukprot:XP_008180508.1 PREDICTED: 52 kDa repressor of the inhibitor of the protein kinase-like [Acyrthosiphon pisum]